MNPRFSSHKYCFDDTRSQHLHGGSLYTIESSVGIATVDGSGNGRVRRIVGEDFMLHGLRKRPAHRDGSANRANAMRFGARDCGDGRRIGQQSAVGFARAPSRNWRPSDLVGGCRLPSMSTLPKRFSAEMPIATQVWTPRDRTCMATERWAGHALSPGRRNRLSSRRRSRC